MASSDNLASFEPLPFRHSFPSDSWSWISEAYARDTDTLTKALQKSISDNSKSTNNNFNSLSETLTSDHSIDNPFLSFINSETNNSTSPTTTPTPSNVSGSEPDTPSIPKRQRNGLSGPAGKPTKRKSRASKKSQTTFITADPANFRAMVQQVTGVRFNNTQFPVVPVLKPEPQRPGNSLHGATGGLPTLDTSAFLLDHHQQQQPVVGGASSTSGPIVGPGSLSFSQSMVDGGGPGRGLQFDPLTSFPTLESWKVM